MFCWPCVRVYQYTETNVMHFSFNLLRIKGLYMFRALRVYPQDVLHKRHLVYCVSMSVGCATSGVNLLTWHSQLTLFARIIPNSVCVAPPENEQVMLETCRGPWFSINWMKIASRWFQYTDNLLTCLHGLFSPVFLEQTRRWGLSSWTTDNFNKNKWSPFGVGTKQAWCYSCIMFY
jgi:hypothetical protein